MSGEWEKYAAQAAQVAYESGAPVWPWDHLTEREQATRVQRMRVALDAVGPRIAEDTRERIVAAAARAVERRPVPPACAYPHLVHGDGRGCETDDCPRHSGSEVEQ